MQRKWIVVGTMDVFHTFIVFGIDSTTFIVCLVFSHIFLGIFFACLHYSPLKILFENILIAQRRFMTLLLHRMTRGDVVKCKSISVVGKQRKQNDTFHLNILDTVSQFERIDDKIMCLFERILSVYWKHWKFTDLKIFNSFIVDAVALALHLLNVDKICTKCKNSFKQCYSKLHCLAVGQFENHFPV